MWRTPPTDSLERKVLLLKLYLKKITATVIFLVALVVSKIMCGSLVFALIYEKTSVNVRKTFSFLKIRCPLVGIDPSPAGECAPPPKGGGAHSPAAKGVGESQFRRLEKKLRTLPTLCFLL